MEIKRVTYQESMTIQEFYQAANARSESTSENRYARCMLDLVDALVEDGGPPLIWGMTSHLSLYLFAEGKHQGVSIVPFGEGAWSISCSPPPEFQLWSDVTVSGHTCDLSEAVRRVRLGLKWAGFTS